ncbi:hypothetical protein RBB50_002811 [Rhinocladiella similis]
MSSLPDYYAILEIPTSATADDIKRAYKKAALKWHPDRVPVDSPERPKRTKRFQAINDAYYTLSDVTRRRDYDDARRFHTTYADEEWEEEEVDEDIPRARRGQAGTNTWSNFFSNFGRSGNQEEKFSNEQFESAFAEMMGEASMADGEQQDAGSGQPKPGSFWAVLGGLSGATLGFIFANFAGAIPGAAAGWKFGRIRDEKKQPVYTTFQQLPQADKAKLLSELATRLFASALGS